jgi:hypothetical protein
MSKQQTVTSNPIAKEGRMRVAKLGLAAALVLGAALLWSRPALADAVFYYKGPHSVPSEYGGFCNISIRHFHTYKPEDEKVFRYDDNTYVFIGDPTAHGWVGPKIGYYGHHKVPLAWGGGWCFISGPHYHFYRPVGAFSYVGGVYYWVGGYSDPWYIRWRPHYERVFSTYYTTRPGYVRPVIYAPPPRVYVGPRVSVPVAAWSGPRVRLSAPSVHVGPGVRHVGPGVRPVGPGMHPGVGPGGRPMGPGVGPGVGPGGRPMGPGVGPGVGPGGRPMGPGVGPGGHPGAPGTVRSGPAAGGPHGPGMMPKGPGVGPGGRTPPGGPVGPRGPGVTPGGRMGAPGHVANPPGRPAAMPPTAKPVSPRATAPVAKPVSTPSRGPIRAPMSKGKR